MKILNFNYKKNKIDQLKGFCATVECGNSVNDAATRNCISATTISKQISSLETDLGFLLFDRVKNKLVLNEKGRVYYKEVKKVLMDLDRLYGGKLDIKRVSSFSIFRKNLQNKIKYNLSLVNLKLKIMLIRVTLKGFLVFLLVCITAIWVYLYRTNWFFDRRIYGLSSESIKSLIKNKTYRLAKDSACKFDGMQMHLDLNTLFLKLINAKELEKIIIITSSECPSMPMRMNGTNIDDKINDTKVIKCDTQRRFDAQKKRYKDEMFILNSGKNNLYYNFYKKKDCFHYNIFENNLKKYQNQLFGFPIANSIISDGYHIILKNKHYYYLITHINSLQSHNLDKPQEQYFIFKKLTLSELKNYDNGSYWKLIKEYNINID
ncbi:LysR family transcriptional regulator [Candidatus Deianiraea vastatrix]|uniref:HTH-type transcriptional activator n=1 Tax=Candidatus Deianiraea vastatrix TaxID=2163644 RepID=A0A5B8XE14_9RICK|nr:LysR family transcriptional regulator [Candidatus Deianiraea vastatrix]QED23470.1 Putative HTH-type transcriptional activator [Candidatus Deianiraea vastatrix]